MHHGPDRFDRADPALGATGRIPDELLKDDDEGEIKFAVRPYKGKVVLDFGKKVAWIGMPPDQADELAESLHKYAEAIRARKRAW